MTTLDHRPSRAEIRRGIAVGPHGRILGLAFVPGVVFAAVVDHDPDPEAQPWLPPGYAVIRVWGGKGPAVWRAVKSAQPRTGVLVVPEVWPVTRWSRVRAWWRVLCWPLVRWWIGRRAG